ncbi:MAG: IS3 family transposase, partial [Beijerinckiaceae bacterium]|nr:IS3 family transposase [Beijerinckiaceae bacterium]
AAHLNATGRPAAQFESSAGRPVAHPAPDGVITAETLVRTG